MNQVGYPTTIILISIIACVTALGLNGTVDSASVTTILGGITSGVLVGHYVKTTNHLPPPPGTIVTTSTPDTTVTTSSIPATDESKGTL